MKERVMKIDCCENCPNFIYGPNACSVTDAPKEENDRYEEGRHVPDRNEIPHWCPLDTVQDFCESNFNIDEEED